MGRLIGAPSAVHSEQDDIKLRIAAALLLQVAVRNFMELNKYVGSCGWRDHMDSPNLQLTLASSNSLSQLAVPTRGRPRGSTWSTNVCALLT